MRHPTRISSLILSAVAGWLLFLPGTAFAAECGWLATAELDRLFPDKAPWRVTVGGQVGRCQFLSRSPPNIFAANQMVHDSPEAAADFVNGLRPEMAKSYELVDAAAIGDNGFLYIPKAEAGPGGQRMIGYAGHRGKVAVIGNLNLQQPPTPAQREAGVQLVKAALAVSDDAEALAAAQDCPWLDGPVLDRILPGGNVRQQVFGENSCMATDDAKAVLTVTIRELNPAMLALRSEDCTWQELPALGEHAALGHACTSGNPRATLQFVAGGKQVVYNLVPGAEPSTAQHEGLIELGTRIRAGHGD